MAVAAAARVATLLLCASSVQVSLAAPGGAHHQHAEEDIGFHNLKGRATQNAPNGYVPTAVDCPKNRPEIRNGSSLSQQEKDWVQKRRNDSIPYIRDLLKRIDIPDFNSEQYLSDVKTDPTALPNIGLAISGGGYRAMLTGAGAVAAWDIRSQGSDAKGNLGGLFQSATYVSALSGGGWLVGSLYANNFTTVKASVDSDEIWQFDESILSGPEQYSLLGYYDEIFDDVGDKDDAGYQRSITDYWGRMLSYQLFNVTDGGPGLTFSSIAESQQFVDAEYPLPFLLAVGRAPGEKAVSINSTVFEFTPWELGSSDPTLNGFVPLEYVGSNFTNGKIPEGQDCVRGFDNAGYVIGTSSSLFNQIVLYLNDDDSDYVPDDIPGFVLDAVTKVLEFLGNGNDDIADWTPNPFKGWNSAENNAAKASRLTLVDGGEDLQNVPYHPHLVKERKVDVVFSLDSSADTEFKWPDGASPIATYERSLEDIAEGTSFPAVPGKDTFLNLGFNSRPAFFGCDASNMSDPSPLIVYIPNYPYIYNANTSTFQMTTNQSERDAIIENGWAVVTQLNGTRDEDWPVCVGCAMLSRSFGRTNTEVPEKCKECFRSYCWNGTLAEKDPGTYNPKIFSNSPIDVQEDFGVKLASGGLIAASVSALAAVMIAL